MRAIDRKLLRDAVHYRSQLAAIVAVVACGVALFVTLRSMNGHLRRSRDSFYEQYRFADLFVPLKRAPNVLALEAARIPGVQAVATRIVMESTIDVPGLDEPATGRLVSIPVPRVPSLNEPHLLTGRWPLPQERDGVLASAAFARANRLMPGDSIGAIVHGRWRWFRITGTAISPEYIYEIGGAAIFPDNRRFGVLWVAHETLAGAFDLAGAFNDLTLTLAPNGRAAEVIAELDRLFRDYGSFGAYGRDAQVSHAFLDGEIEETQVTSVLLPAIFLGVTAFLLHLVLSRLVGTQREQVATLKAFGYTNSTIATHYLALAFIPVTLGSLIGVVIGLWFAGVVAGVYERFFQFPSSAFVPDWNVIAAAITVGAAAGVVGALSAVFRSTALVPAEAMRPEAPQRFRPGIIDRMQFARRLGPAAHIIVRSLERHPGKAALSVIGLALAGGLVVTVMAMFDAVDLIKNVQFQDIMREDVSVTFESSLGSGVLPELRRLPGVQVVEPFRIVPVQLRHGVREYRTVITGLDERARLRRLHSGTGSTLMLPHHGILISPVLANVLDARAGDLVLVEILEGERRTREVLVAAITDEMVGTSVWTSWSALNRLAGTEGTSGAFLAVDTRHIDALYAALKRMPAVSGVGVRDVQRLSFEETISESFNISLVTMLGFAIVIAFGIVYNSARVALSERGRELASLRVLGFTRREVGTMLLGEQAIIALVSLPTAFAVAWALCWLVSVRFETALFRIPVLIEGTSYLFGVAVVAVAGALSALAIRGRIAGMDLVEVLKTRE